MLRHELAVLRRQVMRPTCRPPDRIFLVGLVRMVPRDRWEHSVVDPSSRPASIRRRDARRRRGGSSCEPRPRDRRLRLLHPLTPCCFAACTSSCLSSSRPDGLYLAGITANPAGAWETQQARNVIETFVERKGPIRFLIHDRDSKFTAGFDEVFRSDCIRTIRTPVRAPRANAFIERWIGNVRRECLDRILIVNRRNLERVLPVYIRHYNEHRPHRSLDQRPPIEEPSPGSEAVVLLDRVRRRDGLGGLIHEYKAAA